MSNLMHHVAVAVAATGGMAAAAGWLAYLDAARFRGQRGHRTPRHLDRS